VVARRIASSAPRMGRFCKPISFFYVSDKGKYFISFDSSHHHLQSYRPLFFAFFPVLRKIVFTGTKAIFGGIQRFLNSNKNFNQKLNTDSESAQKTESDEVSYKLF
jgi:hypothetical protein